MLQENLLLIWAKFIASFNLQPHIDLMSLALCHLSLRHLVNEGRKFC